MTNERGELPNPNSERGRKRGEIAPVVHAEGHPAVIPDVPPELAGSAAAQRAWCGAWACPWAHVSDGLAIRTLAELESERERLRADLDRDGTTLKRPVVSPATGNVIGSELYAHPGLAHLRRLDACVQPLRRELGLTPLSRARLGLSVVTLQSKETDVVTAMKQRRDAKRVQLVQ